MGEMKAWALTVCACCIFISLLEASIPTKKTMSVIKLVSGLYILIVLISPLRSFSLASFSVPQVNEVAPIEQSIDVNNAIAIKTGENMSALLKGKFLEVDIIPKSIITNAVITKNNEVEIHSIQIILNRGESVSQVKKIVTQLCGDHVGLSVSEE